MTPGRSLLRGLLLALAACSVRPADAYCRRGVRGSNDDQGDDGRSLNTKDLATAEQLKKEPLADRGERLDDQGGDDNDQGEDGDSGRSLNTKDLTTAKLLKKELLVDQGERLDDQDEDDNDQGEDGDSGRSLNRNSKDLFTAEQLKKEPLVDRFLRLLLGFPNFFDPTEKVGKFEKDNSNAPNDEPRNAIREPDQVKQVNQQVKDEYNSADKGYNSNKHASKYVQIFGEPVGSTEPENIPSITGGTEK